MAIRHGSGHPFDGRRARLGLGAVLLLLLAALPAWSATTLTVRVLNLETDSPVQSANVVLLETGEGIQSDKYGRVAFEGLAPGSYRVTVSHVGFVTTEASVVQVGTEPTSADVRVQPKAWIIDEVVITGTRSPHMLKDVPVQTEVIGQKEFQRTGARTVDEALAWSVGTTVREDMSGKGVALRGLEQDRVLILVDGERAVGRVRGSIDLGQYSLGNVDRIEVVKGTGSTLYGSDAIGGVVNIITRRPEESPPTLRLYADYGSHGTANPAADLAFHRGGIAFALAGNYYRTDGFDLDKSTPHTNGQEQIDRLNLSGKVSAAMDQRWRLTWSGRFMTEDRDWIESEIFPPDLVFVYDDEEINRRYESSANLEYKSGDRYQMGLRLYGTYYDHSWEKSAPEGERIDLSETDDEFYEIAYTSNYVIGQGHRMTYGADWNHQDLRSSEIAGEAKADRAWDGYFQYEYAPNPSVTILPGVRYEHHSSFGTHLNPSFNLMVSPGQRFKFRGYVGGGFRAPSIKEQYFVFDHTAAGYVVYGGAVTLPEDLAVEPGRFKSIEEEKSINSSLSAEISYGTIGMHRVTVFYNHLDNLIDFTLIGFTPTYWRGIYVYQNIATAITRGIEWESRVKLASSLDLSFSYDYLFSRDLDTHRPLLNRPEHNFKLVLSAIDEGTGIGGSIWGERISRKLWVSQSNTGQQEGAPVYAPKRTTFNMSAFKRFNGGVEAFARLENIFDETNVTYGYWPGFQIFTGLKLDLSPQN